VAELGQNYEGAKKKLYILNITSQILEGAEVKKNYHNHIIKSAPVPMKLCH
jgi:hypothetical protein